MPVTGSGDDRTSEIIEKSADHIAAIILNLFGKELYVGNESHIPPCHDQRVPRNSGNTTCIGPRIARRRINDRKIEIADASIDQGLKVCARKEFGRVGYSSSREQY